MGPRRHDSVCVGGIMLHVPSECPYCDKPHIYISAFISINFSLHVQSLTCVWRRTDESAWHHAACSRRPDGTRVCVTGVGCCTDLEKVRIVIYHISIPHFININYSMQRWTCARGRTAASAGRYAASSRAQGGTSECVTGVGCCTGSDYNTYIYPASVINLCLLFLQRWTYARGRTGASVEHYAMYSRGQDDTTACVTGVGCCTGLENIYIVIYHIQVYVYTSIYQYQFLFAAVNVWEGKDGGKCGTLRCVFTDPGRHESVCDGGWMLHGVWLQQIQISSIYNHLHTTAVNVCEGKEGGKCGTLRCVFTGPGRHDCVCDGGRMLHGPGECLYCDRSYIFIYFNQYQLLYTAVDVWKKVGGKCETLRCVFPDGTTLCVTGEGCYTGLENVNINMDKLLT